MSQKFITKWEREKLVQMEDVISQSEAKSYFKVEGLFERWGGGGGEVELWGEVVSYLKVHDNNHVSANKTFLR